MTTGIFETKINDKKEHLRFSIHNWGNHNEISLDLNSLVNRDLLFLRAKDLRQIADDLDTKDDEIKNNLPEVGQKVTFCGQFNILMNECAPLNQFENGDILECIAIKKNDEGEDAAVFWNIDKKLASGLIKNIGGSVNYRNC